MKKLFTFFIALFCANSIFASDTQVNGIWYNFNSSTKTATVTYRGSYSIDYNNEYSGSVVIPETVTYDDITYSVTTIGGSAFSGCSGLTSITIPNSVTTIGDWAFSGCSGLTSVTIPNSVTTIGDHAFWDCSGLISPIYNANYFAYMPTSFNGAYTIPDGIKQIAGSAFSWCEGLTSITIPNSVTTIGNNAFHGCSGLTSVTIPNSVTTIGGSAFERCTKLASIQFGNIIPPTFGSDAFYDVPTSATISVPCGSALNFKKVSALSQFKNYSTFGDFPYVLIVSSSDDAIGTTEISDAPDCITNEAIIKATTIYGYRLDHWSDGNPQNPRTITITQDTHLTAYFAKKVYTVTTYAANGQVEGNKRVEYLDTCSLTALPNYGYHFTQWSDGVTDNPRNIQVLSDTTFTAEFAKNSYSFEVKANNDKRGSITGTNGTYEYQTPLTISATARIDLGYHFAQWSDGNKQNPRTLILTQDTIIVAQFEENKCGNDLIWYLKNNTLLIKGSGTMYSQGFVSWSNWSNQIISISLPEGLTNIGNSAFANCSNLTSVNIPNSVNSIGETAFFDCGSLTSATIGSSTTTIGESAFENCTYLKTITLGKALTNIGCNAFKGDFRIEEITSYAEVTPNVCSSTFDGLSKQYIYLYVPENSIRGYQVDPNWNGFDIRTKSADKKPIDGDNPIVTPSDQDVTITWPITDGASNYSLVITKNGEIVCTLTFNAQGQLLNIAFAAPSHNGARQAPVATLTAQGYQFTVTGLNPGTAYDYSVTATDASGKTLAVHKGNFSTTGGESDLQNVRSRAKASKYFHNGNLIIERNGVKYTPAGQKAW